MKHYIKLLPTGAAHDTWLRLYTLIGCNGTVFAMTSADMHLEETTDVLGGVGGLRCPCWIRQLS